MNYSWPGNVRQLKNITEQISIIEQEREISFDILKSYLPEENGNKLPAIFGHVDEKTFSSEREILYKILFDMKSDMNDLKKLVYSMMREGAVPAGGFSEKESRLITSLLKTDNHKVDHVVPEEKVVYDFSPAQNRDRPYPGYGGVR